MSDIIRQDSQQDRIKISEEVLETIAGIAVQEVANVSSAGGGIADGIAGILGKRPITKGMKAEIAGSDVKFEISIVASYGSQIHVIARDIQCRVREAVEAATGMRVTEVNVSVVGLNFDKENRDKDNKDRDN